MSDNLNGLKELTVSHLLFNLLQQV